MLAFAVVLVLLVAALAWAFIEPFMLTVTHSVVSSPQVPQQFDGTRIVFISDVHAGRLYGASRVKRLIDAINGMKPDLVILGGDFVGGYSGGLDIFFEEARRLKAPLGVLAVLGNHDVWEAHLRSRARLKSLGATLLDNRHVRVMHDGAAIIVGGVNDPEVAKADVAEAARGIPVNDFSILVSHDPDVFAEQLAPCSRAFDLALAGHNHGGQVTLFGLWAPVMPSKYGNRYRGGWIRENGVDIFDSRGIGTVYVPVRFFSPPEIVVLDLKSGPKGIRTVKD